MTNDDELDDGDDDVVCCWMNGRVGWREVCFVHTKFCVGPHKILCKSTQNFV